nr:zinc finger protein CONSTANS-LIKE 4-like [Ipomoea trifida]
METEQSTGGCNGHKIAAGILVLRFWPEKRRTPENLPILLRRVVNHRAPATGELMRTDHVKPRLPRSDIGAGEAESATDFHRLQAEINLHGGDDWELNGDGGDSCKRALATVFCHADTAFLCVTCDSKIHAANKLASCQVRHRRPLRHDRDYHSANPLAHRHERLPVVPFYYSAADAKSQALRYESKIRNRDDVNFAIFLCG